jgi:SAM-dependent methyltransferase
MLRRDLHEENRVSWNEATVAHNSHKAEQAQFFKNGGNTLFPEELNLLGDINEQKIVHLQCNAGQDSISLALLGADVLGVDISDTAINFAQELSAGSGVAARFVRADLYDWFKNSSEQAGMFDIAFSSYGAIVWLSDLGVWAKGVASILKPGGRLILVDFHPLLAIFDDKWTITDPYFSENKPSTCIPGIGDYVADSGPAQAPSGYLTGIKGFSNPYPSHEFQWTIGDILTAVVEAGLRIKSFQEYPYSNGAKLRPGMVLGQKNRYYLPDHLPQLPLMYGLKAQLT